MLFHFHVATDHYIGKQIIYAHTFLEPKHHARSRGTPVTVTGISFDRAELVNYSS
jgi:hypothetical protein